MDKYTAQEMAFKHGYEKGYADALAFAKNELKPIKESAKECLQKCKELTNLSTEEKHGHWIIHKVGRQAAWAECSECLVCGNSRWKRCPVCEAKMDLPSITAETKDALKKMGENAHGGKDG